MAEAAVALAWVAVFVLVRVWELCLVEMHRDRCPWLCHTRVDSDLSLYEDSWPLDLVAEAL